MFLIKMRILLLLKSKYRQKTNDHNSELHNHIFLPDVMDYL